MKDNFFRFLSISKKAGKLAEGYNKSEISIEKGISKLIILAEGISDKSKKRFTSKCEKKGIFLIDNITEEELNSSLGTNDIKIVSINDKNFSDNLINLWNEKFSGVN